VRNETIGKAAAGTGHLAKVSQQLAFDHKGNPQSVVLTYPDGGECLVFLETGGSIAEET
jgi:hypothetical protein